MKGSLREMRPELGVSCAFPPKPFLSVGAFRPPSLGCTANGNFHVCNCIMFQIGFCAVRVCLLQNNFGSPLSHNQLIFKEVAGYRSCNSVGCIDEATRKLQMKICRRFVLC